MPLRLLKALGSFSGLYKACATTVSQCPRFGSVKNFQFQSLPGLSADCSSSASDSDVMASKSMFDFETRYLKKGATNNSVEAGNFFRRYDAKGKGYLDPEDFSNIFSTLFSHNGKPHNLTDDKKQALFDQLDRQKTGKITLPVFSEYWSTWFRPILDPVSVLLVIDVQNDFISGSLAMSAGEAKQNGEEVVPVINKLLGDVDFDHVIYTRDWHPPDHISFHENRHKWKTTQCSSLKAEEANMFDTVTFEGEPSVNQVLWPTHCVRETEGAALHKDLKIVKGGHIHDKGLESHADYYSAFKDQSRTRCTSLADDLIKRNVTNVYTCGIAYDFCVGETSVDAAQSGFRTVLIEDATRGTSNTLISNMKERLKNLYVPIVNASEVADLVNGKDRRPELVFQATLNGHDLPSS